MHYQPTRRVAIVGSKRIPFLRANTNYAESSNQDMMTARFGDPRVRKGVYI